jgi:glycosyltransferase involved in cell wall biosynthesis
VDWIDAVPVRWQYWPARLQERTFARNAARVVAREHPQAFVYAREVEAALPLLRNGRKGVFLEVHRVPEGRLRRAELLECAQLQAGCVAISGGVQADLLALGVRAEQVVVEHDGFESTRFAHLPDKAVARQKLGLAPDVSVVVYTGGLLEWKGVDVLVDAARLLPEVQFVIAGGMASDVRIDGFVAPELVSLYLAAGDVGVVPNRSQPAISSKYTSPLKVFESLCSGLPLVVSDLPSMRDVLTEHTAEFVQPDDPAALAAGLQRLLADPVRRAYLTEHGRSAAHGRDWDTRAQRLVAWMDAYSKR